MAPYALRHPEVPLVMDFVDVDSAKWRAYADEARFPMRSVYRREAATLQEYEREVARRAVISTVTADRKVLLAAIAPGCDARTLANGVDTDYFGPAATPASDASAVFFGAMDYHANVEAAVFLVREVMPRVRARYPDFRVVIAGSRPTPEVLLAAVEGVTVTVTVEDIRPYVTGCAGARDPAEGRARRAEQGARGDGHGRPGGVLSRGGRGHRGGARDAAGARALRRAGSAHGRGGAGAAPRPGEGAGDRGRARQRVEARYGWEPRSHELLGMLTEASERRARRA